MDTKELKKYLISSNRFFAIVGALIAVFGVVFTIAIFAEGQVEEPLKMLLTGVFVTGFGALLVWLGTSSSKEFKAHIQALESSGEMTHVLADFAQAQPLVKDKVRMGQNYIFGKGENQIVRYEEIRQVYQYIHKRNFVESDRSLKYVNSKGETKELCVLQLRGKSDEAVKQIVTMILMKNPNVKVGYNK